MPAKIGEPFAERDHLIRRRSGPSLHEVKPRTANTVCIETSKFLIADVDRNQRNPAIRAAGRGDGVHGDRVVVAVAIGLDDDPARNPEPVMQRVDHLLWRIRWRIVAHGREGELRAWAENV